MGTESNQQRGGCTYSGARRKTCIPAVNVFSVNPETNQPYMTLEHAEKLIWTHINKYAQKLCKKIDPEDLKQELLIKLLISTYKPEKSKPKTFAITCMNSRCMQLYSILVLAKKRGKGEVPDFLVNNEESDEVWATMMLGVENVTPEDYLLAGEVVSSQLPSGQRRALRRGFGNV